MDKMVRISQEVCENCPVGRKFAQEEVARCIKKDWAICTEEERIDEINNEIEIILY